MESTFTIGEFARLTHLPVKTLRHYHEVGVLVPAGVDPSSGYRRYSVDQVGPAHLVRRLRAIDLPLADVRAALEAPDERRRNEIILGHLDRVDRRLAETQAAVASLRSLLEAPAPSVDVRIRQLPGSHAVARTGHVETSAIDRWCAETFPLLYEAIAVGGGQPSGPGGGRYGTEFFEEEAGRVVLFVPTTSELRTVGDIEPLRLPPELVASAVHAGPFDELDRTYGALGTYVSTHDLATAGEIREHYLVGPADRTDPRDLRTEVCWPIRPPHGGTS